MIASEQSGHRATPRETLVPQRPGHRPGGAADVQRLVGAIAIALAALPSPAATIVGSSDLLDAPRASQLEAWLGAGPLMLTNLFDKTDGDTGADFRRAVDGKGATFSILEVLSFKGQVLSPPVLIGGYNPLDWDRATPDLIRTRFDAERSAFVFNLTQNLKFEQRKDGSGKNQGRFQSAGGGLETNGPSFGGGHDIGVFSDLIRGYSHLHSYGSTDDDRRSLVAYPQTFGTVGDLRYGRIEVFGIAPAIPEPAPAAMLLAGLGLLARRRYRLRAHEVAGPTG